MADLFFLYQRPGLFVTIILIISLWSLVWKAFALWKAARKGETVWFILILVLNTAGILPIIYLLISGEPKAKKPVNSNKKKEVKVEIKKKPAKKKVVKKKSKAKKRKKK